MRKLIVVVFLSLASMFATTNSLASTCPSEPYPDWYNGTCIDGLVPGSYPNFETSVGITWTKKDNTLSAKYNNSVTGGISLFHVSTSEDFAITNTDFDFLAVLDPLDNNSGTTGKVVITGNISDLGINGKPLLMSADLTGVYRQDGTLIGFNTMNIVCNPLIDAYVNCTSIEVIYFDLEDAIDFTASTSTKKFKGKVKTTGTAITSVPLPAAAWLFGFGLLGLIGIARRATVF